jgi:hypothetical protein
MEAAARILEVCEERGWEDPDIQKLSATLKDAKAALAKNSGAELP